MYSSHVPKGVPAAAVLSQTLSGLSLSPVDLALGEIAGVPLYYGRGGAWIVEDSLLEPMHGMLEEHFPSNSKQLQLVTSAVMSSAVGSAVAVRSVAASEFVAVEQTSDLEKYETQSNLTSPCRLHLLRSITVECLVLPPGCLVAFNEGVILTVSSLLQSVSHSASTPITLTVFNPWGGHWGGIVLTSKARGEFVNTLISFTGGSKYRVPETGTHIKATPAITASSDATLSMTHCVIMGAAGPGFGLGPKSVTSLKDVLVQDVAQGGECVGCEISIVQCHFVDIPHGAAQRSMLEKRFVDHDNDGFYFRGGKAVLANSVIVNTMDDCIDSASSRGDKSVSTLEVLNSVISNCLHEGIALSGSTHTKRTVTVTKSIIQYAQQGVEMGYSPKTHEAVLRHTTIRHCQVGVRIGDNYRLAVEGDMALDDCVMEGNAIHVLRAVRKEMEAGRYITDSRCISGSATGWTAKYNQLHIKNSRFSEQRADSLQRVPTTLDVERGCFCGTVQFDSYNNVVRQ